MAKGMINRVTLIGELEEDPEVETLNNQDCRAFLRLRTIVPQKQKRSTSVFSVVTYGKAARYAETLREGDRIYVEGYLQKTRYDDGFEVRAGQVVSL
jgi:single-stranded DNA-binding protein